MSKNSKLKQTSVENFCGTSDINFCYSLPDEYDRNDKVYIVRNRNGIILESLNYSLKAQ